MRKKNTTRLNESTLHRIIKESLKRVLRETSQYPEYYKDDDDPGWDDYDPDWEEFEDDYLNDDYYEEDPRDAYPSGKQGDIEYSWDENEPSYPGLSSYYRTRKDGIPYDVDKAITDRNAAKNWSQKELEQRDRFMKHWLLGRLQRQMGTNKYTKIPFSKKDIQWRYHQP